MRLTLLLASIGFTLGMGVLYLVVGGLADLVLALVERRRAKAVDTMSVLLFESDAEAAEIFDEVVALPRRTLLSLIQTLAVDLDGYALGRLQRLAAASGLQRFIRRRSTARRWRLRVQGAQLNYLVTHPDFERETLMTDSHPLVRTRAVEVLTHEQAVEHIPLIVSMLDDESVSVRMAAQTAIITAGSACVPELLERLGRSDSSLAALEVAANLSDSRLTDAIERFTYDLDPNARMMACRALGNGVGNSCIGILERLINDDVADVRSDSISALGQLGAVGSVTQIGSCLSDRSFLVRRSAGLALDILGPSGHLILRTHLSDDDPYARDMARQVLDAAAGRVGLDIVPELVEYDLAVGQ